MPDNDARSKGKRIPLTTDNRIQIFSLIYEITLIRCFVKWIIRLVTGTCELQRILRKYKAGVCTVKIEQCLQKSKIPVLRQIVQVEPADLDAAIIQIMSIKNIVAETNPSFLPSFKLCLEQIYGYENLLRQVEDARAEKFDCENKNHEELLLQLWDLMRPDEPLKKRICKQWGDIGFQGEDPKTDFRGMGILSLKNLIFFAENHTDHARQALQHSQHPQYGYSYAIVGINITSMAYEFMCNGLLRSHFFNKVQGRPELDDFHEAFCFLLYEFDKFWIKSDPENVMAFGRIRDEFKQTVEAMLKYVPSAMMVLDQDA